MKLAKLLLLGLALNLAAAGCQHKHSEGETPLPGTAGSRYGTNSIDNGNIVGAGTNSQGDNVTGAPITDPRQYDQYAHDTEIFKADTVHFAYDSSSVKDDDKSKVSHVADYLKSNPGDALEVEGHCDERGTEEYNRSLGERRALAIREELIHDGIDAAKVVTISYGKDRPASPGHDEAARAENRRGVFILLTPPAPKTQ